MKKRFINQIRANLYAYFSVKQVLERTKKLFDKSRNESLTQTIENEFMAYQQCLMHKECKRKIREEWTKLINLHAGGV